MRLVVYITYKFFYITVARQRERDLKDVPLAILRDNVVLDASREAEKWDVHPGISRRLAQQRCRGLVCTDFNPDHCRTLYEEVWRVFAEVTPLVEPVDFHAGYLDLTGCVPWGKTLTELVNERLSKVYSKTGLRGTWGGGRDKWLARLSCGENRWIAPSEEEAFLARVSVRRLGVAPDLCERFRRYGIRSVGELMNVPQSFFQTHLRIPTGELPLLLQRGGAPARALFPPPVVQAKKHLHWGDEMEICRAICHLSQRVARELDRSRQQAGHLRVILRSANGETTLEMKPTRPLGSAETLERFIRRLIGEKKPERLREIRLILEDIVPLPRPQIELWQDKTQWLKKKTQIEKSRQVLERKYGFQTIRSGADYAKTVPPRFAQLVYARRGIYLP